MSKSFRKDLTGQRFGRLTVLEFVPTEGRISYWKCKCDCGNETVVQAMSLKSGNTRSCGCLCKEINCKRTTNRNTTHGKSHTRLYNIWKLMKSRCLKKTNKRYKDYGGRGITVCDKWQNNFQAFYDWAMSNGYDDSLTIDRIDNNGNYEPLNCRWADTKTQVRNSRHNIMVKYNGEKICLTEAAEKSGINHNTLIDRYRHGDRGEHLFRPVDKKKSRKK